MASINTCIQHMCIIYTWELRKVPAEGHHTKLKITSLEEWELLFCLLYSLQLHTLITFLIRKYIYFSIILVRNEKEQENVTYYFREKISIFYQGLVIKSILKELRTVKIPGMFVVHMEWLACTFCRLHEATGRCHCSANSSKEEQCHYYHLLHDIIATKSKRTKRVIHAVVAC